MGFNSRGQRHSPAAFMIPPTTFVMAERRGDTSEALATIEALVYTWVLQKANEWPVMNRVVGIDRLDWETRDTDEGDETLNIYRRF